MRVILDTNVFVSGIFFSGPPYQILMAWQKGDISLVLSPDILEEYHRVGRVLETKFGEVDITPILHLLTINAELKEAPELSKSVCDDPDDDKFLACAVATKTKYIISGDKKLLAVSGYSGIEILSPRIFVDDYLPQIMH